MQATKRASAAEKITPARGRLVVFALVFLGGIAASPAHAVPFTDIFGRTCDTSQLITDPTDPSGPSVCPGNSIPGGKPNKVLQSRIKWESNWLGPLPSGPPDYDSGLGPLPKYDYDGGPSNLDKYPLYPPSGYLGMYVTPDTGFGNGVTLGAGGYSARSSGVGVTDKAGLLAPGSLSTSFRTNAGTGGISGSYDASYLVGSNQKLVLNGAFNYTSSNTGFSAASGSINSNTYGFKGSALYSNYATYLVLRGSYEFGNNNEFFAADASSGSYRSDGYNVDARLGHVFVLFNTIAAVAPSRMPVKAPPRPSDGYRIGLDLSGHLGYSSDVARGFTDTSGFTFGDERAQGGETGLRAKLFAEIPRSGVIWQPYISGSVDWRFGYSHIASFPTQVALAGGDAVNFADGTTFVGAQAGLDVKARNGWIVGVNGFYSRSSDTEVVGGRAYVRIPFGPAAVVARY
jgi:Autotransporter beta-domain